MLKEAQEAVKIISYEALTVFQPYIPKQFKD